jgi:hypothetical protein
MADFIKTPFTDRTFKEKISSDYEGAEMAGGDIRIGGKDVVIGGPQIAMEGRELFKITSDWTRKAK